MKTRRKRVEARSRQANWQAIELAEGRCPHCGGAREAKPGGGYYRFCHEWRMKFNEIMREKMRERRRAGLAE